MREDEAYGKTKDKPTGQRTGDDVESMSAESTWRRAFVTRACYAQLHHVRSARMRASLLDGHVNDARALYQCCRKESDGKTNSREARVRGAKRRMSRKRQQNKQGASDEQKKECRKREDV